MKYKWILFDADETLYSFNSFEGIKRVMSQYDVVFERVDYERFQSLNQPLWVAYQNKEISAEELQIRRFTELAEQVGQDPMMLAQAFSEEMAWVSQPLTNVREVLNELNGKVKMGIISNGFRALQDKRLENTKTAQFFEFVVVSEDVGIAKPDPFIFEYAFRQMGENIDKSQILMVGDTISSDILGANQVGIDSCWFNPHGVYNDSCVFPTYEIHAMQELLSIVKA